MKDDGIDLNDLPGARVNRTPRSHPLLLKPGRGILPNPQRAPRKARRVKQGVPWEENRQRIDLIRRRREDEAARQRPKEAVPKPPEPRPDVLNRRLQTFFGVVFAMTFVTLMTLAAQTPTDTLQSAENEVQLAVFDDSDGDGFTDDVDAFPFDSTQWSDVDGDGYGDNPEGNSSDAFPNNPNEWNDTDDDGVGDNEDVFPLDSTQWSDFDGDGYGDNPGGNSSDAFPENPDEWVDTDGDGVGDNGDACPVNWGLSPTGCSDTDGDGFSDDVDAFPWEPTQWADRDGDGYGDNPDGENKDHFPDDPTRHSFLEKLWFYFVFIMCTLILGALIVILSMGHPLAGAGMCVLALLLGGGYFLFL